MGKEAWIELVESGGLVLKQSDVPAFAVLASLYAEFQANQAEIGPSAIAQMRLLMAEFGLVRSARKNLTNEAENPFAAIGRKP